MDAHAHSQAAKINYVGETAGSSLNSSLQQTVRTLESTLATDVGQILREGTPLFALKTIEKRQGVPSPSVEYNIVEKEIARREEADLKGTGGNRYGWPYSLLI